MSNLNKGIVCFIIAALILVALIWMTPRYTKFEKASAFFEIQSIDSIDWHPDSRRIAVASGGVIISSLDHPERSIFQILDMDTPSDESIKKVAWSPSGDHLAIIGHYIGIWNGSDYISLDKKYSHYRIFSDAVWTKAGDKLLVSSFGLSLDDNSIWIWDANNYVLIKKIQGDGNWSPSGDIGFFTLELIDDDKVIFTSSIGNSERFWDITRGEATSFLPSQIKRDALVSPCPSGDFIAIADENGVRIESRKLSSHPVILETNIKTLSNLKCNDRDTLLMVSSEFEGKVEVWDILEGKRIYTLNADLGYSVKFDWHPKENFLAIATKQVTVVVDIDKSTEKYLSAKDAYQVHWSPDGEKLALVTKTGVYVYSEIPEMFLED